MKFLFLVFIATLPLTFEAQGDFFFREIDTVKLSSRVGGTKIDSLPDYFTGLNSLNPGGFRNNIFGDFSNSYGQVLNRISSNFTNFSDSKFKFSALPHIGFMYSFGSKATQVLHVDYQQFYSKKFGLNFSMNRNATGDLMRASSFKRNEIELSTRYDSKKYKNFTRLNYFQSDQNQNGGLDLKDSSSNLSLELRAVNKNNASSLLKQIQVFSSHYINFSSDSLTNLGIKIENLYKIKNREFFEVDSLKNSYASIFLDSLQTRDQFQDARISNSGGLFVKKGKFYADLLLGQCYWDFQNLGAHRDTNELFIQSKIALDFNKVQFHNEFKYNLLGAKGEKSNIFSIAYKNPKFKGGFHLNYSEMLPELFQRSYFSNNYSWTIQDIQVQKDLNAKLSFESFVFHKFNLTASFQKKKNNYFFVDSLWRNDTLTDISIFTLNYKSRFALKNFLVLPNFTFNFANNFSYLPKFDLRTRIGFNGKVFKSKKLDFIFAIDFAYLDKFSLFSYTNALDLFVLNPSESASVSNYSLGFFTGFQVDEFRFYVKAENLSSIWNKKDNRSFENIPTSPLIIRIGLTWDFFN